MKSLFQNWRARLLVLWPLVVCVCVMWGAAAEKSDFRINIALCDGATVSFAVESTQAHENALLIVATYTEEGKMLEQKREVLDLPEGSLARSQKFAEPFFDAKVFLLDVDTLTPLCHRGGRCNVVFADHDGSALAEQTVYSGRAAVPPKNPVRTGYVFVGWDTAFDHVYSDTTVKAVYAKEDAENLFVVSSASGGVGDEVTLSVALQGTVDLCGFDMRLIYDKDVLEYVSHDAEHTLDVVANHVEDKGSIRFNFSSRMNKTSAGTILTVTYKIKNTAQTHASFALEALQVIKVDPLNTSALLPAPFTVTEGTVWIE